MKNKKIVLMVVIALFCALILIICYKKISSSSREETKLNQELSDLGSDFYQNFFYQQLTEEELKTYASVGKTINLDSLDKYAMTINRNTDMFVNSKTKEGCNTTNSKVTIYPVEPYKNTDFNIVVSLECGF